jgi:hypothetical protein
MRGHTEPAAWQSAPNWLIRQNHRQQPLYVGQIILLREQFLVTFIGYTPASHVAFCHRYKNVTRPTE